MKRKNLSNSEGMEGRVERRLWTEEETILALYLYFQLPFGKLDQRTPEVRQLASALGRKDGSVAMKLANFASLDPKIVASGRKGLDGASKLDRAVYAQFGNNWDALVERASELWLTRVGDGREEAPIDKLKDERSEFRFEPFVGESTTMRRVAQRLGQNFFRRAVLANYDEVCCVTGIAEPQLLIASHIRPWNDDVQNRHNPTNGLLLSATMDKAFDRGLMTVTRGGLVRFARRLLDSPSERTSRYFRSFDGAMLRPATRFDPDPAFIEWHNQQMFVDRHLLS